MPNRGIEHSGALRQIRQAEAIAARSGLGIAATEPNPSSTATTPPVPPPGRNLRFPTPLTAWKRDSLRYVLVSVRLPEGEPGRRLRQVHEHG